MMGRQCWCSLAGRWPALRAGSGARNLIHGDPRAGGPASAQHSPDFPDGEGAPGSSALVPVAVPLQFWLKGEECGA